MEDLLGRIAVSKKGRDQGRIMLVIGVLDEEYVLICDGDSRKIEKPKKKKLKHLTLKDFAEDGTVQMLRRGETPENHQIRRALAEVR